VKKTASLRANNGFIYSLTVAGNRPAQGRSG